MSNDSLALDGYKVRRWLNARKFTNKKAAESSGLSEQEIRDISANQRTVTNPHIAARLAKSLNLPVSELVATGGALTPLIHYTREQVLATKREVFRGGFHFYNYYSFPCPQGFVAPVLIDILCPENRDPVQNNGHLEPAITINLGPNDIYGLWGDKSEPDAWHKMMTNKNGSHEWIIGDSYVEPPYQPHSYSRAENGPAQILSYTVKSNLAEFVNSANQWSDDAFSQMEQAIGNQAPFAATLTQLMRRRGYDAGSLAAHVGIGDNSLTAFLEGDETALGLNEIKAIGEKLGADYRLFMPPMFIHDRVGKTWCTVEDSIESIREFESYTVASMSAAPQHTDLMGLFIKVESSHGNQIIDLADHSSSHYYVTAGSLVLHYLDETGQTQSQELGIGDAMWVAPFTRHGFSGDGALIKMGNGEGISCLDQLEFSNTYQLAETLNRCRKDQQVWGFDETSS